MGGTGDVDFISSERWEGLGMWTIHVFQVKGWRDWGCGLISSERWEGLGMWTYFK